MIANDALDQVTDEVRLLYHLMTRVADLAHADKGVTAPMRAVLDYLDRHGSAPVPRIAQARGVSRQHIQTIVNELAASGLVDAVANPAHRRSPLVELTQAGRECIGAVADDERRLLGDLAASVGRADLAVTARTLRTIRRGLGDLAATLEKP